MPRLSLYRPNKTNDYRFFDRNISEQLTTGGTDLYIHKYLGPTNQGPSVDYTQPEYDALNPNNIQDLLFLENRDRTYDTSIYRLRGQYNVQNLDFNLTKLKFRCTSHGSDWRMIACIKTHKHNDMRQALLTTIQPFLSLSFLFPTLLFKHFLLQHF